MDRPPSGLPTKLGQAPTTSPRTTEKRRQNLGSLFSSLTLRSVSPVIVAPLRQSSEDDEERNATISDKQLRNSRLSTSGGPAVSTHDEDEGCYIDDGSQRSSMMAVGEGGECPSRTSRRCMLMQLPDELLIAIMTRLPASPDDLLSLSLVSRRMCALSRSSQVWAALYHSTPGYDIVPHLARRVEASEEAPRAGQWQDHSWLPVATRSSLSRAEAASPSVADAKDGTKPTIPVHYPTLYRSRAALQHILQYACRPPRQEALKAHTDSVYCVQLVTPWLFTGSRDRSIRIWRLPDFRLDGGVDQTGPAKLAKVLPNAHDGSVLGVKVEMNDDRTRGTMVTGSSDMTAAVWDIRCTDDGEIEVEQVATLRGHEAGVLDVALSTTRIATCSKDTTIRIYDREDYTHLLTIISHAAPINSLAVNPDQRAGREELVSASSDGWWIAWDMLTGKELRRGAGDGRGLACITWEGSYILTGDNDRSIKVFLAATGALLRCIEGHTELVRSVAVELGNDLVVSGSYDRSVRTWRLSTGEMIKWARGGHASSVFGVATERGRIVSVSHDYSVQILTYGADLPYRGLFA